MRRKKRKPEPIRKTCVTCERTVTLSNFYTANEKMFPNGKMNVCKKCVKKEYEESGIEYLIELMQHIDRPFISTLLERNNGDIGQYLRELQSLPQYSRMTFKDSVYNGELQKIRKAKRPHYKLDQYIEEEVNKRVEKKLNIFIESLGGLIDEKINNAISRGKLE